MFSIAGILNPRKSSSRSLSALMDESQCVNSSAVSFMAVVKETATLARAAIMQTTASIFHHVVHHVPIGWLASGARVWDQTGRIGNSTSSSVPIHYGICSGRLAFHGCAAQKTN